jgi:putative transposase
MKVWLDREGYPANRKRVRRLMRTMGLQAIYRRPRTSKPALGHRVYPYLLGGMEITRPNQVWAADITYIPMARGFHYLVAIMDWYTRYVVAWNLSNTLDADFCVEALEEALGKGRPEVFNTDQGSQFTGASSPARPSPDSWSATGSESAWTGKGGTATTYSWSGCGGR